MRKIKYIDLFAGCGGLSEGFLSTNLYDEVAAVEWEKPQVETLRKRLRDKWGYLDSEDKVLHFDIQREKELLFGWEDEHFGNHSGLNKLVEEAKGIDIIIGGPPCQAYSIAGRVRDENGMRNDYRNYLFEHYLNIVNIYRPKLLVFENVPGMLSAKPGGEDGRKVVDLIREGFNNIGYEITEDLNRDALINSNYYGVPQNRKRVIIVGIDKSIGKSSKEIKVLLNKFYNQILPTYKSEKEGTVYDAIGDLQKFSPVNVDSRRERAYKAIENSGKSISWHIPRYHSSRDKSIFKLLAEDIESGENKYIKSEALTQLYEEKIGSKSQIHRYYVLRKDKPSTTIIAHLYKDGNRFIHYDPLQERTITPREAARIQSFDDDFEFIGSQGSVYKMIGNAVPPNLAKSIAYALYELYREITI